MKKLFLLSIICLCFVACNSNDDDDANYTPDTDLFVRADAEYTLIPLLADRRWTYSKTIGTEEKPDCEIKNLLLNDQIVDMKILPVRQFDNNDGSGKYEYQALCYITENNTAYFYMDNKILVGRYLESDNYGNESAIWDFELPTHCTENSSRYFALNRNVSIDDPGVNIDENFLHEMPGYYTIDVEVDLPNFKRYTDCKLFLYNSHKESAGEHTRPNYFYFKEGVGLIRYQQFVKVDTTLAKLYEQNIVEK
ncbi:MAG: hypothetical protein LBO69_09710 [Ignavibacteria bacterium]|jgi:hypothetical protein|nr:hypothetical protein [Ignavibacteria bacterium]